MAVDRWRWATSSLPCARRSLMSSRTMSGRMYRREPSLTTRSDLASSRMNESFSSKSAGVRSVLTASRNWTTKRETSSCVNILVSSTKSVWNLRRARVWMPMSTRSSTAIRWLNDESSVAIELTNTGSREVV
eukprot:Amastigsp_a514227_3.p4 type:complete len:132 gc:universal Amastigsp_a514227_3:24-419(+)